MAGGEVWRYSFLKLATDGSEMSVSHNGLSRLVREFDQ
jgi:hypothetical protein